VVETPCIGVCQLDERFVCIGCGRNQQEIALWLHLPAAERRRLMDDVLPARLESLG
jgi:predicted Fe-S protein YdhL (DUF1289 family)